MNLMNKKYAKHYLNIVLTLKKKKKKLVNDLKKFEINKFLKNV